MPRPNEPAYLEISQRCAGPCNRLLLIVGIGVDSGGLFLRCPHCGHHNRPDGGVVWVRL